MSKINFRILQKSFTSVCKNQGTPMSNLRAKNFLHIVVLCNSLVEVGFPKKRHAGRIHRENRAKGKRKEIKTTV